MRFSPTSSQFPIATRASHLRPSRGASDTIESLAIGAATLDLAFDAWSDEQDISLVVGSQGGSMIPLRARVEGASSDCMLLGIALHDADGAELSDQETPLRFYPQDDGSLLTETYYVFVDGVAEPGTVLTLSTTVGTESAQHTLHLVP